MDDVKKILNYLSAHPYGARFTDIVTGTKLDWGETQKILSTLVNKGIILRMVKSSETLYYIKRK